MTGFSRQIQSAIALEVDEAGAEKRCWLSRLKLERFRNYRAADLSIASGQLVVLGENGAGKTNLLEAVSLLAPGRGMRRAKGEQLAFATPAAMAGEVTDRRLDWAVAAVLESEDGALDIGTGVPVDSAGGGRVMRLEGMTVSQAELGSRLAVSWLTPQMDGVFLDSPAARRRFLDRLVIAFDPAHIGRMSRYEKALRQRAHLLAEGRGDAAWYGALEAVLAETAVAVTAARQALIKALNAEAAQGWFGFPGVELVLSGAVEDWLVTMPALAVEDRIMAAAKTARLAGDAAMPGPHISEFQGVHLASGTMANVASTGQQKAMLIAIILAHARLQDRRLGRVPVMLFDDIAAHLDAMRRAALFEAVQTLGGQCWYSGTDEAQFSALRTSAQFVKILPAANAAATPTLEVIL